MKIKILRNLGLKADGTRWPASPDGDPYHEGEEVDAEDHFANELFGAGLAEPATLKTVATPGLTTPPAGTTPLMAPAKGEHSPKAEVAPEVHHETGRRGKLGGTGT